MSTRRPSLVALVVLACTSAGPGPETPERGVHHPPPKPGSSITHTKICECQSCEPRSCCDGEADEDRRATCSDGYDFTSEGCGLDVPSCTTRCTKHVWRVPLTASCNEAPRACC